MSSNTPKRIHRFDDAAPQEQKLVEDAVPEQTRTATNFWLSVFQCFCREKQVQFNLKTCLAEELDDCLRKFYQGLKTKKGETYRRSSYLCARSALQRHLLYMKHLLDWRSASFKQSNEVLEAVLKGNKAQGYCKPALPKDVLTEVKLAGVRFFSCAFERSNGNFSSFLNSNLIS